ncbi:DUF5062 family protein [Hahella ganghwensis]|uniref:DUF5062 family protein n=1 Tax=Hahella ganghwensis TaxID=286420 RepID=UPI00035E96AF|nr:DUF5062 family protein [Hahella ganghwensis]
MKKLKNEKELVKKAIEEGVKYGESRGVVEFEPTDSANEKIEYIYRLLVHDKVIQPLPEDQVSLVTMKHKLAIWASKMK